MTETKICPDCGEEVIMLIDKTGMLIRYEKMCPCIIEILELRKRRAVDFKTRKKTIRDEMRGALFTNERK